MQKVLQLLLISATLSFVSAQDAWGGISVATPDNLNAISSNPAGLGLPRGTQSGMYVPFDSVNALHLAKHINNYFLIIQALVSIISINVDIILSKITCINSKIIFAHI